MRRYIIEQLREDGSWEVSTECAERYTTHTEAQTRLVELERFTPRRRRLALSTVCWAGVLRHDGTSPVELRDEQADGDRAYRAWQYDVLRRAWVVVGAWSGDDAGPAVRWMRDNTLSMS